MRGRKGTTTDYADCTDKNKNISVLIREIRVIRA